MSHASECLTMTVLAKQICQSLLPSDVRSGKRDFSATVLLRHLLPAFEQDLATFLDFLCLVFFACLSRAGYRLVFYFTHCCGQCCHCHLLVSVLSIVLFLTVFFVRDLKKR